MSIVSFTEYPQSIGGQQAHTPAHSLWPAVPQTVAGTESVGWGHRADSPSCSCGWAGAARGRPLPLRSPVPPARCLHTGGRVVLQEDEMAGVFLPVLNTNRIWTLQPPPQHRWHCLR